MKIGIVGLGLIGGSLARALTESGKHEVYGADRNRSSLLAAKMVEAIKDEMTDENIGEMDMIFIALYPQATVEFVEANASKIKKDAIVADCGGVKRPICTPCEKLAEENGFIFIGAHPMAGTQFSGFNASRGNLFKNATMIITPKENTDIRILEKLRNALNDAGFGAINFTTPEEHDKVIAFTSQLPHIISNAYVKSHTAVKQKGFSAGSYRDLTRVSKLNEKMWSELFFENKDNLCAEIDFLVERLSEYSAALKADDREGLVALLKEGTDSKKQAK
ncbi:MAG: prephenate dehydrogenase [Ruminococcaceae bacterium]|nr:prephenate dehydrogenase [Oscillospiraceae bacterium]